VAGSCITHGSTDMLDDEMESGDVESAKLESIYLAGHVSESSLDTWHIFVKWCGATWPIRGLPHGILGLAC
jgi:hypothetical protein